MPEQKLAGQFADTASPADDNNHNYVVFKEPSGVMTWTDYGSKTEFDKRETADDVVAHGISADEARDIVNSPANDLAIFVAQVKEMNEILLKFTVL